MKKITLTRVLISMLALVVALGMTAQTSPKRLAKSGSQKTMKQLADEFAKKQKNAKVITAKDLRKNAPARVGEDDPDRWEVLVDEDFALMTKGTEDVPDTEMMPENGSGGYLPDSLFHTPNWFGIACYQAGGCVALNYPGFGGVINTPMMNLQGRIRVQTRLKAINKQSHVFVQGCTGGYDFPSLMGYGYEMNLYSLKPEDGWVDVDIIIENPYAGGDSFIQINAANYNYGGIIVDYLTVSRDKEYVSTPHNLTATKFVTDGFTASWEKAYGAESYLVTLYERKTVGTDNYKSEESFEDVSVENGSVVGMADGWTAQASGFTDDACDGGKALLFKGGSDFIQFGIDGSEILAGGFSIKKVQANEGSYGELCIDVTEDGVVSRWILRLTDVSDSEWKTVTMADFKGFPVGHALSVRMYIEGNVSDVFAIDKLYFETTPLTETTCVAENIEANDACLAFNGLDLNNLYSFTVQGNTADGRVSDVSEPFYAYGVAAPVVKEATEVDRRGGYTANWEPVINATSYDLFSYEIKPVTEDTEDYTIFEENFNKCTEGTVDNPVTLNNYDRVYLNDYTDNIDWTGYGTIVANGMVGCMESFYSYVDVTSPAINLNRNDGNYTVTVDFVTFKDNTTLIVQGDETMYQEIFAEKAGAHSATVEMYGGNEMTNLMFYSKEGTAWLLDRVVVKQDVKAGDEISKTLDRQTVDGYAISARISGLQVKSDCKYGYNLVSYYDDYGYVYVSDPSAIQYVEFEATGIGTVEAEGEVALQPTEIYDLSGRKVSKAAAKGVYIIKTGDKVKKVRF